MKSNVPWSVKGIDPEARVVAKAAAKEAGLTLGEWMNQAIRQIGEDGPDAGTGDDDAAPAPVPAAGVPASGVTTDQLRAVVDSLNRLNDRLTSTEEGLKTQEAQTRQTAAGLGQGLETVYERMKRLERERREGTADAIQERVEKLERGEGDLGRIDGLKRLESALTSMVEALEVTRTEAITKITENEEALDQLASRVDTLDERLTAGFSEVHDAIDAVGQHLDRTERTASAVLSDAKAASGSTDQAFVEQTSKRLQALGNEIKRSGDQIRTVEEMVGRLSAKIEAAEHRSAEGIGEVAASLQGLRAEVGGGAPETKVEGDLAEAAREADKKVSRLQRSYETMMARLDGRAEPEAEPAPEPVAAAPLAAAAPAVQAPAEGDPAPAEPAAGTPLTVDVFPATPTDAAQPPEAAEAPEAVVPAEGQDDDFDEVFEEMTTPQAPPASDANGKQDGAPGGGMDLPPMLGGAAGLGAGAGAMLATGSQGGEAAPDAAEGGIPKLTARQKVLLAARARKKRLEAEREAEEAGATDLPSPAATNDVAPDVDPLLDDDLVTPATNVEAAEAASDGQNRKVGIGLLLVLTAAIGYAIFHFFGPSGEAPAVADASPTDRLEARMSAPALPDARSDVGSGDTAAVPLPSATADAKVLYDQGITLLARGQETDALRLFEEAASGGYAPAQFRAGHAYYDGIGTDENLTRAEFFLSDAALNGNVLAMHYLGNLAFTADEPNLAEARDWFTQAAEKGVISSAYNLGYLYDPTAQEPGVPEGERDAARAYYWYAIAGKQGDVASGQEAEAIAARLTPEKIAEVDEQVARWSPLPISPSVNDGVRLPG